MVKFLFTVLVVLQASFATEASMSLSEMKREVADLERQASGYESKIRQLKAEKGRYEARGGSVPNIVEGRLTATASTPITILFTSNNTTVRFTPFQGNKITLYYRSNWRIFTFSEISLALSGTVANSTYDVFAYRASTGTVTLELSAAWSGAATRTDALALQDGIWVKSSDRTRRYLGTLRTNGTANRFNDNVTDRGLWNYYNRVPRMMYVFDATNTWTYNANAWRQAGADVANDVSFVIGINEVLVLSRVKTNVISAAAAARASTVGIGVDTTTANSAQLLGVQGNGSGTVATQAWADYLGYPGIGYHTLSWIESTPAAANVTQWGDNGLSAAPVQTKSGIFTVIEG